ncbi:carbohydrate-binding family 9-like protein [bacterium]|nr:carbohydrate-binding family 9-like protein [bacterium]
MHRCTVALLLCVVCGGLAFGQETDGIEFADLNAATAGGWDVTDHTTLSVTRESKVGRYALLAQPQAGAKPYRGMNLHRELDLTGAGPADRLGFWVKQTYGSGMRVQLWTARGPFNRSFAVQQGAWTRVELDLDPAHWENPRQQPWGVVVRVAFYEQAFMAPEHTMVLDGLSITAGGKPVHLEDPAAMPASWRFPQQTEAAWFLGNADVAWAISKATGQVVGGWNVRTQERLLNFLEGRYHLEDRKSLVTGQSRDDRVRQAQFREREQRLDLTCANPTVPDLTIGKQYWLSGNKLFQRVAFRTTSRDLQFITFNTQAAFTPAYRNGGYHMGGADGGGPLVPAPQIGEWQKVTQYQSTAKSMLLHQPARGYSFAHTRTKLDDQFVWPFFTGAIASYVEAPNAMSYTPDGWDMSLGTSKLSPTRETSYEQFVSIFPGDWQTFLRREYPALPEVQQALRQIPPVPAWVSDIKIETGADLGRLRQMVQATDEGTIMVLLSLSGSWADYYVDRGMEGGYGGWITGPELRDHIRRIKALSPRIKVGLYMWQLSTYVGTRIHRAHPEWFRHSNKDGEPLSTFPGMAPNFAQLLSIPACYQELLSQFDTVLNALGTDFIYLDDPKAINLIEWQSGEYTRDDLSFRFFLDLKRLAARHSPDTMIFFNNRGNPYGDVNFIEARDQLRANYWRNFAGLAAVTQAFVSSARPDARINLLYFTPPLRREYMNRVLALGWLASLDYCGVVASRPFFQAAYEVGNCTSVPARYEPDWKSDKTTNLESYAVQRHGDRGVLLSFINHAEDTETVPLRLDVDSLNLDRTGRVFVWGYEVEDALAYEGQVTESLARRVYRETGWQLDRVTRRRLLWSGPYQAALDLKLEMKPLILHQLYVTAEPAAVYSENGLAGNYLFGAMPRVALQTKADWQQGTLKAQVDSRRDEAEIILLLPLRNYRPRVVTLDGKPVRPDWVCEGDEVFPVVKVGPGRHVLDVAFAAEPVAVPARVSSLTATASSTGLTLATPGLQAAVVTVARGDRVLYNRLVAGAGGKLTVPLSPARPEGGAYTVAVHAVVESTGELRPAEAVETAVELPAAKPDLGVPSERATRGPNERTVAPVNRTIRGLEVLNAATLTSGETPNEMQPGLGMLTAQAQPDTLTLTAGTSRAILQGQDGLLGAAFAGLEVKNLRRVQLRLANTFHSAFHMRGPGFHVPERANSRNFAGIVVDYHTPAGYTKRVAFATGVLHRTCSSTAPDWGRARVADESRDLGAALVETPERTFALDLQPCAPADWDGQVWLSVGSDWICPNRRLELQILAANEAVTGPFLSGVDPKAFREAYAKPRRLAAPRSPGGIIIDGSLSEESWREAARTEDFFLLGGDGVSRAGTAALLMYDDTNLYVAFVCTEPDRKKPLIIGGPPWDDDEVEVWIDADGDGKTYRQVIVNGANSKAEYRESGPGPIGATTAVHVVEGAPWTVEMEIPCAGLDARPPRPGDTWKISLCRGRAPGRNNPTMELMVWAPLAGGFKDLANFGTLTFR